ncbi:hypothetical protein D3C73_1169110 [compost metagenome]
MRQCDQIVIEEAPPHDQQIIFLLHLLYQLSYLLVLIAPHDESVGDQERATAVNGRSKILDDGIFILPQQNVQPQILLMQISQQWRPIEAEQGRVEEIQVRLK